MISIKPFTLAIHALVWLLLLIIPFASTHQVLQSFVPSNAHISFAPVFVLSMVLISIFYFNYFFLIPKYLLTKKYWFYFPFLLLTISIAFLMSGIIFYILDFSPDNISKVNPLIKKISPIVQTNAFLMLIISIITSILLALNNRLKQTEKEKLNAQLASLKSQINPHFLFNTLNNIYATAIDSSPQTADMVEKLSDMMRYTTRDTQQDFVLLEDEVNYVNNFIELQKMRLDRSVKLEYHPLVQVPNFQIAPMLLIPFVENAFKHGVNSEQKSHIKIQMAMNKTEFQLNVTNKKVDVKTDISERSGLGIENTKHRLDLMYPSRYLLVINSAEKEFSVSLHINLQ